MKLLFKWEWPNSSTLAAGLARSGTLRLRSYNAGSCFLFWFVTVKRTIFIHRKHYQTRLSLCTCPALRGEVKSKAGETFTVKGKICTVEVINDLRGMK